MNKPAIAIIEDEIPAARLLHSMIARLRPEWDITVIPGSVEEATEWFATHPRPSLPRHTTCRRQLVRLSFGSSSLIHHHLHHRLRPVCSPCVHRQQHRLYPEADR